MKLNTWWWPAVVVVVDLREVEQVDLEQRSISAFLQIRLIQLQ
jgi:hypothetical protein